MRQTQHAPRAVSLSLLTLLAAACAPGGLDEGSVPLAQASIDGSVRITPTDAGVLDADGPAASGDDAGDDGPVPAGETVELPDGGVIYLDESCPDHETLFGSTSVGCCVYRKCGLSNHTLDFPGVSRECQSYDEVRALDDTFDLPAKACRFGPAP